MIIVTGSHRSGTSLLAMTMRALGFDFGPGGDLYDADQWNEQGYLERKDVMDVNSRLVTGFSRSSGGLSGLLSKIRYLSMPSSKSIRGRGQTMAPEIIELALQLGDLAVKDPRFCLTLPEWMLTGRVDFVVISVRHPYEVALSLKTRQRVPVRAGLRFWEYHLRSLLETAPEEAVFINHSDLVGGNSLPQLRKLAVLSELEMSDEVLTDSFESVFAPRLHHEMAPQEVDLPSPIEGLWQEVREKGASHRLAG